MRRIMYFALTMVLSSFFVLLAASGANAQATASATLQGTVADQSDAAIKGARITLTSKEQGWTRNAESSDTGSYRFDLLPAGFYTLKVSAAGFNGAEATNIELHARVISTPNLIL